MLNVGLHIVHLTMRHHLFLKFWLVDTWFFADWRHHHAVTCLENVCQSNIRRSKNLGFHLSHKHPHSGCCILDYGRCIMDSRRWTLDTVADWFRTESELSFWFWLHYAKLFEWKSLRSHDDTYSVESKGSGVVIFRNSILTLSMTL